MDFESLSNNRFFLMLGGLLNMLLINLLFVLSTVASGGILLVPSLIALFGVTADVRAERDYEIIKRYVTYLIAHVGYGLKLTLILIPIAALAFFNTQIIQFYAEISDNVFVALMSFFVFAFLLFLVILTALNMMLWRTQFQPMSFRKSFNYSFAVVMSSIRRLVASMFLIVLVGLVMYLFPFALLFGLIAFFTYGFVLIYEKHYRSISEHFADMSNQEAESI
ncbi:MAG: hypothetical protein EA374_05565 [Acholeplasmatales bacterium]|nr:MAG: hypothetical protein EA374_05565 [Acholeplasmatales bacterium]